MSSDGSMRLVLTRVEAPDRIREILEKAKVRSAVFLKLCGTDPQNFVERIKLFYEKNENQELTLSDQERKDLESVWEASRDNFDLITSALKEIPSNITHKVFSISKCSINISDRELSVEYSIHLSEIPKSKPTMIIEYAFSNKFLENQTMEIEGKVLAVSASLKNIYKDEGVIERNRLSALLILEDRGFEIDGCS